MDDCKKSIVFVCNVDYFFISHRLPLAIHGIAKGYDVIVMTKDTGRREEIEAIGAKFIDIPFERSGINPIHELKCVYLLIKHIKQTKPTIIHNITLKSSLLGSIAAKLAGYKNVINAISGFGYNFTDDRNGILQRIIRFLIKVSYKSKTFHFILQNPDDLNTIQNMQLVPRLNTHLIKGSGIDLNKFGYKSISLPKDKLRFLFPARLLYDKGIVELINAANLLKSKLKGKVEFILAGDFDSDNLASIKENDLKSFLIPGYISWIGYQNNMYSVYVKSDVVVLPSYREGLPKSLIEACAVGRPIITTDVPGCRECVIDKVNGCLIEVKNSLNLANAILYLYENQDVLNDMGLESRKLAEKEFSIDIVIEKTYEIYNSFLNG